MRKKNLYSEDSKFDLLRRITNDEASNINGGNQPPININLPPPPPVTNYSVKITSINPPGGSVGIKIPF